MKTLGIDFGTKKVGLAISDGTERVAFPYSVLTNPARLLSEVEAICKKEDITAVVLGESKDFSGKENPVMEKVHKFKKELEETTHLPVYFEPEFLSSKQARNILDSGAKNDASAAAIILQSFLDRRS